MPVAVRRGRGARTVYVRFATKAVLLRRCLDVAIAGDHHRVAVPDRDWFHQAMSAPTAEALEPEIAERAQAAREMTHQAIGGFFRKLAADGLMSDEHVDWGAETGAVLGQAETYLLLTSTTGRRSSSTSRGSSKRGHDSYSSLTRRRSRPAR